MRNASHTNEVNSVAFSPDGRYALSGSSDTTLKLWQVSNGQEVRTFKGHTNEVNSVAFSPDGRYALSGSYDATLKLWEVSTGQEVRTFKGHTSAVNSVAFSPDGRYALSGSDDETLKLWELWRIERTQRSLPLRDFIPWERENARALAPYKARKLLAALQREFANSIATNTLFADRVAALSNSLAAPNPETAFQCLQAIPALRAAADIFRDYDRLQTELNPLLPRSQGLKRGFEALKTQLQSDPNQPAVREQMCLLREQAKVYAEARGDYDRLQSELKSLFPRSDGLGRDMATVEPLLQSFETLAVARERMGAIRNRILRQAEASRAIAELKNKYASFATPGGDFARDCVELEEWFQADRPPEAILERTGQIRQQAAKLVVAQREYERLRTEFAALFTHTTALATELGEVERRLSTRRYDDGFAAFGLILELRERAVVLRESLRDEHFAAAVAEEARQDQRWRSRRDYGEADRRYRIAGELGHPQAAEHLADLRWKMA